MEYFLQAKFIRLRTRQNKFLAAGDDGETVRQTRNGHTKKAQWVVELVNDNPNTIRLRSCHNKLLTASDEPFLLGWTGKKVTQTNECYSPATQWEPIRKDFYVMLRAPLSGKFLRVNHGTPPWKDSVTVDVPEKGATKKWMLWQVDILDVDDVGVLSGVGAGAGVGAGPSSSKWLKLVNKNKSNSKCLRGQESRSNIITTSSSEVEEEEEEEEDEDGDSILNESIWSDTESKSVVLPITSTSRAYTKPRESVMELLKNAKRVRLRSHHDKYLVAEENQESVSQDKKNGGLRQARWTVEYVNSNDALGLVIRLKSCYDKYLTAVDENYLTGVTGKKVKQTAPQRLDSSIEWEPVRVGMQLKFKTRYGNFLRANGGPPPWRNTVTHDIPNRTKTLEWILWDIDVLEVYEEKKDPKNDIEDTDKDEDGDEDYENEMHLPSHISFKKVSTTEGRVIHYNVVDDDGNIIEGERSLVYEGKGVEELSKMLEKETGLSHIIACSRNPLTGKLYPIMLSLPPNHVKLHIYVVPSSSKVAADLGTI